LVGDLPRYLPVEWPYGLNNLLKHSQGQHLIPRRGSPTHGWWSDHHSLQCLLFPGNLWLFSLPALSAIVSYERRSGTRDEFHAMKISMQMRKNIASPPHLHHRTCRCTKFSTPTPSW